MYEFNWVFLVSKWEPWSVQNCIEKIWIKQTKTENYRVKAGISRLRILWCKPLILDVIFVNSEMWNHSEMWVLLFLPQMYFPLLIYNFQCSDDKELLLQDVVSQLKCLMSLHYLRQNGVESQNTWKSFPSNDRTRKVSLDSSAWWI